MSEREEVNEISFIREAFIEGRTYLYTQTGDLVCNIAELLREYDALRVQLTTAERERDEARRERDHWLQGTHMLEAALRGVQGIVFDDGYHINVAVLQEERDEALHRAERAERVVEAADAMFDARDYNEEMVARSDLMVALTEYRALDAAEGE